MNHATLIQLLQNELREAHLEALKQDAVKRAANHASYNHDTQIGWDAAWGSWAEQERTKQP